MSFARQTIRGRCQGHDNRPSTAPTPHCPPGSGRTIRVLIKTTNGRVVAVEPNSTDSVARLKELVGVRSRPRRQFVQHAVAAAFIVGGLNCFANDFSQSQVGIVFFFLFYNAEFLLCFVFFVIMLIVHQFC